jgi:hypothetical protein
MVWLLLVANPFDPVASTDWTWPDGASNVGVLPAGSEAGSNLNG